MKKYILTTTIVALLAVMFSGCSNKVQVTSMDEQFNSRASRQNISDASIVSDTSKEDMFLNEKEDKFYSDAKLAKIWVATYKTKSNIRVRSHFIDEWVQKAEFNNIEYMPEFANQ